MYHFGLSSADLVLVDVPIWLPEGKGPAMAVQLTYHRVATQRMASYQNVNYYSFGNKWTMNYASHLTVRPSLEVEVVLPGGRVELFSPSGNGQYSPLDPWNRNTLFKPATGPYKFTFDDSQESWYYNASSQDLERIEDRYGYAVTIARDAGGRPSVITDALGRTFTFGYNSGGYVTRIDDNKGRHCSFGYLNNNLVSMTDMGGLTTALEYDASRWLTKITYPNGSVYTVEHRNAELYPRPEGGYYDQPYRMRVTDNLGQTQEYFYHAFDSMGPITVTDKAGNAWLYAVDTRGASQKDRIYADAVEATAVGQVGTYSAYGYQWEARQYSSSLDLVERDLTTNAHALTIGYPDDHGVFVTDQVRWNYNYNSGHDATDERLYVQDQLLGHWQYQYGARHTLTRAQNPLNQVAQYGYDSHDRVTSVVDPLNRAWTFAYDAQGNPTEFRDPRNHAVQLTYNADGFNTEVHYPDGRVLYKGYATGGTYNNHGRVTSVRDGPTGFELQYAYDDLDRVTGVSFPDGSQFSFAYGCCGVEQATDRLGRTTYYSHDTLGRPNLILDPLGRSASLTYNGNDQMTELVTRVGQADRTKRFQYEAENGSSRLRHIVSPLGKTTHFTYSFKGNLEAVENHYGTVGYEYDNLQRFVKRSLPDGTVDEIAYRDVLGNVDSAVRTVYGVANSAVTYNAYDALNRVTLLTGTLSVPGFASASYGLGYQYDEVGNLTQRTLTVLAATIQATYVYDSMDRLTSVSETASGLPTATAGYEYDSAGRLWAKTYGNNDRVEHRYDAESRLSGMTVKNGAATVRNLDYTRDRMGNLLSIAADGTLTSYQYDAAYQLTRETLAGGTVNEWTYDTAGNILVRPGQAGHNLYNGDDELTGVSANAQNTTTVSGTVAGGANNHKWYNTWAECRGVRARVSAADGTFQLAGVPLDAGENTLTVTVTDVSGNSSQQVRHVTKSATGALTYDNNGNPLTWSDGAANWSYEWNALNQLASVSKNGAEVLRNWYDGYGRRIAKQEVVGAATRKWYYVYDGWAIIAVLDGATGALVESYTRGLALAGDVGSLVAARHHQAATGSQLIYLHANHRGDVILARNGATTAGAYDYAPYGALRSSSGSYSPRFGFSSKELDASAGLCYYGYRFYSPTLQRWLSRDPIGEAGGVNLYAFSQNNSLTYVDISGLDSYVIITVGGGPVSWTDHADIYVDDPKGGYYRGSARWGKVDEPTHTKLLPKPDQHTRIKRLPNVRCPGGPSSDERIRQFLLARVSASCYPYCASYVGEVLSAGFPEFFFSYGVGTFAGDVNRDVDRFNFVGPRPRPMPDLLAPTAHFP